jgi:chloramphenicol 3-O-phosphotransferase
MKPAGGRLDLALPERTGPLEELRRLATEAESGQGRLVLVGGEAGVGKTSCGAAMEVDLRWGW